MRPLSEILGIRLRCSAPDADGKRERRTARSCLIPRALRRTTSTTAEPLGVASTLMRARTFPRSLTLAKALLKPEPGRTSRGIVTRGRVLEWGG